VIQGISSEFGRCISESAVIHEETGFSEDKIDPCDRLADFASVSSRILRSAIPGVLRADFLRAVCRILLGLHGYDAIELRFREDNRGYRCIATDSGRTFFSLETMPENEDDADFWGVFCKGSPPLAEICRKIVVGESLDSSPCFTSNGSFWTPDMSDPDTLPSKLIEGLPPSEREIENEYRSVALIPFTTGEDDRGVLYLKCKSPNRISLEQIEYFEGLTHILSVAFAYRQRGLALRERVKELTCLHGIARLVKRPGRSLDEILTGIVRLLPPAWLYPEVTCGRIVLDGNAYMTPGFREGCDRLRSDLVVNGDRRGFVEVVYTERMPELDKGPFLGEERSLIDVIAREVSVFMERWEAEEENWRLQEQLRHADRLATIGQLAAGVAHELNEPLGNILGFAQLAQKSEELPDEVSGDLGKIISASLHAREVIRNLMVFARQTPAKMTAVDLNDVVEDGLSFFEGRFGKANVELVCSLSQSMQPMSGDPAQLNQVLVNLVVNALQAMPEGGTLTVKTEASSDTILLIVEDTGTGMSEEVMSQIFMPFFTTKDVDEGTGLGLAVVHGIVGAHGGSVEVESEVYRGSRFVVSFPVGRESGAEEGSDNGAST
jgi:signal transduction histidine kinase